VIDVGNTTTAAVQVVSGQKNYYVVQAYNAAGQLSTYSAEVLFPLSSTPIPMQTGLSPMSGLAGTSIATRGSSPAGPQPSRPPARPTPKNDSLRATDYDGDGRSDPATYVPATGTWAILLSGSNYSTSLTVSLGTSTDVPVP
jgi:hypothetical protein